jgi:drug/metabolite transporter (DMT)-like permease
MLHETRIYVKLAVGLTLAIVFDTVQQLAWKSGIVGTLDTDSPKAIIQAVLQEPLFGLVALIMVLRLVNWLKVLEHADLTFAQPITSLSYVTVTVASAIFLKEKVTLLQLVGMAMIIAGVWCISQTKRLSFLPEARIP